MPKSSRFDEKGGVDASMKVISFRRPQEGDKEKEHHHKTHKEHKAVQEEKSLRDLDRLLVVPSVSPKLERSHHGLVERDDRYCKENDP